MSFWKNFFGNQDQLEVATPANDMGPTRDEFLAETLIDEEVPQKEIRAGEASECFHEILHYAERDLYHDAMHETYRANGHLLLDERLQDLTEAFQKKLELAILKLQGVADDIGVHEATFNAAGYLENALMFANKRKGIEREISFLKTALEDSYSRKGLVRNRLESFKRGFYQAKFEVVQNSLT